MKKKKVIKLKEGYVPQSSYFTKDALLTNIFQQSSENFVSDVECKNSQLIVNCINKLHKKNLQTKLKAINELMSYLSKYDEETVSYLFSSFLSVYKKLIYHPNYNLRESLNVCLKLFIEKIKTKIKKHINVFLPPLYISFFDYNKNVNKVSSDILSMLFPLKEDLQRREEKGKEEEEEEEKKKKRENKNKLKLYNENKLYLNIKKLNINITNFYNCLIYIKNDLDEEVLNYIKTKENSDDYDRSVYLFNVLCLYPSLLYMIIKFCKINIIKEYRNDNNKNKEDKIINNNMEGNIEYLDNHNNDKYYLKNDIFKSKIVEIFKIEYNNFSNTYNSFFMNLNSIYKENKDDVRIQKMLYLCVYNIIYLLKKIKINFMSLHNENIQESLCNYICCIINNKDEYIYKTINHLLLLLFFIDNKKIIKENFLKNYLSLVKQNKIYSNDVFNYNICLFIFLFKKDDIQEYFFFFFFLFYFLLINNHKSSIVIYYDVLLHLYDYFLFISLKEIQNCENEVTETMTNNDITQGFLVDDMKDIQNNIKNMNNKNMEEKNIKVSNSLKEENNKNNIFYMNEKYCSYVLCAHILLLPLEIILIQKKLLNCNYSYKNKFLYENLINRYYCNKKKKINHKKDVKEKDKLDDLKKKIKEANIDEKHFLLTFINFLNSSKNKYNIIFSSLDLISVYVNNMNDELNKTNTNENQKNNNICNADKKEEILKDEKNKKIYNDTHNITNNKNVSQTEYVEYYEVIDFLFHFFSQIKNVLFISDISCDENVIVKTRHKYISTLNVIFINTFMLIKNNHHKLMSIVKNNILLLKFFFSQMKEQPSQLLESSQLLQSLSLSSLSSSSFSLNIIFDIINNTLRDKNINKDVYFASINVGLNILYMFFVIFNGSSYYDELAKMFFSIIFCEPLDEDKVEEKFKTCIYVLQFMKRENVKLLDQSCDILKIYYHYIMNKSKDEELLKTFYDLIYEDEKTNRNKLFFEKQFYIDLFYIHKKYIYLTQSLPDITFCSFFCKLFLEKVFRCDDMDDSNYDCTDDNTNNNNLYIYLLLLILLRVDFNYGQRFSELFMVLDKKILLRYLEVLRGIYKSCKDEEGVRYDNRRKEKNILHNIVNDIYSEDFQSDDIYSEDFQSDDIYSDDFQSDDIYSDACHSDELYSDNELRTEEEEGYLFLLKIYKSEIYCGIDYEYDNIEKNNLKREDNMNNIKNDDNNCNDNNYNDTNQSCDNVEDGENNFSVSFEKDENMKNMKNMKNINYILNNKEKKQIEQYVFIKRKNILSSIYNNRLLLLYKIYHNIYDILPFTHVIHCTYYFCLDVDESNDNKTITKEMLSPLKEDSKLEDSFFNYIYKNIKSKKLYKFLKNVYIKGKNISEKKNINEKNLSENYISEKNLSENYISEEDQKEMGLYKKYDNLNLYFIIYKYIKKNSVLRCVRKKVISEIMMKRNKDNISFYNIIYVMKNIEDYKIFRICKSLLKYMNDNNYISLDEILYYLKDINMKNNIYLKLKIFLYKEFIIKKILVLKNLQYIEKDIIIKNEDKEKNINNKCNKDNEHIEDNKDSMINVETINETNNLLLYNNNDNSNCCDYIKILECIKDYVPDYLHSYIDNNFKLNIKNELQYLNLFYHLIYISKYTPLNLFIYKSVQNILLESLQIISLCNYDIIFYCLEFILSSPNYFSFFIQNKMVTENKENIFLNYSYYIKIYYKRIYDKYIRIYKNKRIIINNILSNTNSNQNNTILQNNNNMIILSSQTKKNRNKLKNKQSYENNKGIHFLKFMYQLLEQHREVILFRYIVENKKFIQLLLKIIYFILSIYSCKRYNNVINERCKNICVKILKEILNYQEKNKKESNTNMSNTNNNNNINSSSSSSCIIIVDQVNNLQTYLHSIYKIYLLSLKFGVTEYYEYFEGMNIFFNNIKNKPFDTIKKHEEKKILDIYINTYYLYILFSNINKFKENKIFIDETFLLLFLNCLFIKRLHDLKNEGNDIFEGINKYFCLNNNTHNEFLHYIIEKNMEKNSNTIKDNKNNDHNDVSDDHNDYRLSDDQNDYRLSDDKNDYRFSSDKNDYRFSSDNHKNSSIEEKKNEYTTDRLNDIFFEDAECISDSSLNISDDEIVSSIFCAETLKKERMNDIKKKKKKKMKMNENEKYQINSRLDGNIKDDNNDNDTYKNVSDNNNNNNDNNFKRKKNISLYFLKKSLKNPFLLIDVNKNILDLYSFLLEMNYLKILLSMLNICLSSEYFIYDQDIYQQFLLFIESNNFNIFNVLKDIKNIDTLIQKNKFLKKNKKKVYIFFFSLYLILLLITTYPNESIIIINKNKLYNIITFNQIIFSNLIINYQLNQLKNISAKYVNTTYSYDPSSKILSFKYKIKEDENEQLEDMTAKLTLTFLPNYPFSHFIISDKIESLDKKAYIHNSIKSMYKYSRNGDINEIFIKFDSIMNNYFANKAQCNICFMLLYDKKTCDKNCLKCNASYHSHCLHKWFLTSHNTKCPSCQMQFS
ncbi:conserved Plasmodium protein, unknown function [Plasmodium sp. gorilla clade G2]|uniref:conserved Plasmodium protein, unknown function n=1 Tax=Plasmodium sp. gorilla clade G2 TaxID=880535 RepID=UPI000D2241B5|nr:conserved Plasmodium protein, unknown function [Plasmodium sp. gorilla clade G2]SOV12570.1 conserved Plasmodium protein, unknown function [Plasmodium sp. gorilla clade G2]